MKIDSLIQKLFEKRGIEKIEDLSPDEKTEYERWQSIMDGGEITVDRIKKFCESQIRIIEEQYASSEQTDKKDTMLRASLHIYLNLLRLINSSEIERVNLEKYLTNLLKT